MTTTDTHPIVCPSWCQTDHAGEQARRELEAARLTTYVGTCGDQLLDEMYAGNPPQGRQFPAEPPAPETHLVHSTVVGSLEVDACAGAPASLFVLLEQGQHTGDSVPMVSVREPTGWCESYTLEQARSLSELLEQAAELAEGRR